MNLKVLNSKDVLSRMQSIAQGKQYLAYYSSLFDGVVTDPSLMVLPADDHMTIRGHGVFDTGNVVNGRAYRLNIHLERFVNSAKLARLELPMNIDEMRDTILNTVAITQRKNCFVRYFLSAGPGDFSWLPYGCKPAFYVVVQDATVPQIGIGGPEVIVTTPMKNHPLTEIKSNNYLMNVLMSMEAVDHGGKLGIWVTPDGYLAEGCVANIFQVRNRILRTAPFENILMGCTARRILDVGQKLVEEGLLDGVEQVQIKESELFESSEMFSSGGDTHITPITELKKLSANAEVERCVSFGDGPIVSRVMEHIIEEATAGNTEHHLEIPYEKYAPGS